MSNTGTLLLPQLHSRGNPLLIEGITRKDAEGLITNLAERTKTARKLKYNADAVEDTFFEVNAIGSNTVFSTHDEIVTLELLAESTIPGLRGERAVFFETANYQNSNPAAFLVGTTIIYNANWATLGVVDLGVIDTLTDETYENDEDEGGDEVEDDDYELEDDDYEEEEEDYDDDDGYCEFCGDYH